MFSFWTNVIRWFCGTIKGSWPLYSSRLRWVAWLPSPWWREFTSACVTLTMARRQLPESFKPLLEWEWGESSCWSSLQTSCEELQKSGLLWFWPCPSRRERGPQRLSRLSRLPRWARVASPFLSKCSCWLLTSSDLLSFICWRRALLFCFSF